MELIKKTVNVSDAKGWYLVQNEKRYWTEDFVDEETGEVLSAERSETVCERGSRLNEILISLLEENGVKTVTVSNIPILGNQEKYMKLWEAVLKVTEKGKPVKRSYIVTADSPSAAEAFISEHFQIHMDASFELVKVNQVEYNRVIKVYDAEREEYEAGGRHTAKWYRCQVCATVDDDGETCIGSRTMLVLALSFENAMQAVKQVISRDGYGMIYNTLKAVQGLNVVDVFIPDEAVCYYSNEEL
jgi:hypothetical protein